MGELGQGVASDNTGLLEDAVVCVKSNECHWPAAMPTVAESELELMSGQPPATTFQLTLLTGKLSHKIGSQMAVARRRP